MGLLAMGSKAFGHGSSPYGLVNGVRLQHELTDVRLV